MNGKNKHGSLLRRGRAKKYKSSAFKRYTLDKRELKFDPTDFSIDYSDDPKWKTLIGRIAMAQRDYPDGVGIKIALACVKSVVRDRESRKQGYAFCSPDQLERALDLIKRNYRKAGT